MASLSLVSAAAATGVFGEPVHVPVISRIAQSLDLVPVPAEEREPALARAETATEPAPRTPREKLDRVIDDPEFRALPPAERRAALRRTAAGMVQSGEATRREVVTALRDTTREQIAEMTPRERRQARRERIAERREVLAQEAAEGETAVGEGSGGVVR